MQIPGDDFLDQIEQHYGVTYPGEYRTLCARMRECDNVCGDSNNTGTFISDIDTFWEVNMRVGHEQWGDYERAIVGQERLKDKHRLWGGILPFFFDAYDVFGFAENGNGDEVLVWSVHTIVHSYPTLADFCDVHLRR